MFKDKDTIVSSAAALLKKIFNIERASDHYFIGDLSPRPVVVDLGAGKADFSKSILKEWPDSTLIMVEPDPGLYKELFGDFNGNKNIKLVNAAVGYGPDENIKFYPGKDWNCGSLINSLDARNNGMKDRQASVIVKQITLKYIFDEFDLDRIDLLKVDIEGAEIDMFKSFSKQDFDVVAQISVEFHDFIDPGMKKDTLMCVKKLMALGYSLIHRGTKLAHGSRHYDCLFYKRDHLTRSNPLRWYGIDHCINAAFYLRDNLFR